MKPTAKPLNCLIVDDEEDIRDIIGFVIESDFHVVARYAASGNEAIEVLKKNSKDIDFIVCDYNMPNGSGGAVFKFLNDAKLEIPFILCSSSSPADYPEFKSAPLAGFAEKPFFQKQLLAAVGEILKKRSVPQSDPEVVAVSPDSVVMQSGAAGEFIRVHIRLLKISGVLPCEIFIRLSENKFVKIHHSQDVFSDAEYQRYLYKCVEFLYIQHQNIKVFFDKLMREYSSSLALRSAEDVLSGELSLSADIQDSIHDIGSKIGFTKELEQMTKTNIERSLKLVAKNPSLSELLRRLDFSSSSYISKHSIILSHVACWLASKMHWQSDQTFVKLILASFLHDIVLTDDELAKVQQQSDLHKDDVKFSAEGSALWKQHMTKAAQIAAQFSDVPPDVDVIVGQHHERPHGDGSPYRLNYARIAPLAALFIVAHDLVNFFEDKAGTGLAGFVEKSKSLYDVGQFKRMMQQISLSTDFMVD